MRLQGKKLLSVVGVLFFMVLPGEAAKKISNTSVEHLTVPGLKKSVEIFKDIWGISHIYAKNQPDLFFAQGFNVARDRLFQLEIWRRQASGTLAEVLGARALKQDIGARLLKARVDMGKELRHYHPDGEEIIGSFVRGINAYIELTRRNPSLLPLEFQLLDILPGHWTPEIVVSRHNGLFRNVRSEISMAKAVAVMGPEKLRDLLNLHPGKPDLILNKGVDASLLSNDILDLYMASRARVRFTKEDLNGASPQYFQDQTQENRPLSVHISDPGFPETQGSNNWVISGRHTVTGAPFMANDPHRSQQVPSLRYWVHLQAPGWDVIGGGEPALPGVSIGHNRFGAWGLTIFSVDQEDLFVYDTLPEDPNRYRFQDNWEKMIIIRESIPVRGQAPAAVELKYTRHGPVLFQDRTSHKAYALRASWLEIGCAPYLASLRMDQARTWKEFRHACTYSRTPSENMIWADRVGNIGWQAVGITPIRAGWEGLLPVPGDGRFEWEGYLPIESLPHALNPTQGYFSTANQDNIPAGYPHTIGFLWTDPFRQTRIQEVLGSEKAFSMTDMKALQHDVVSVPAQTLVPLLKGLQCQKDPVNKALSLLSDWDFRMSPDSVAATIYQRWQGQLSRHVWQRTVSEEEQALVPRRSLINLIKWLKAPDERFGPKPLEGRDALLLEALQDAVEELNQRLGQDMQKWQYGQEKYHHIRIRHLLSDAIGPDFLPRLDIGPFPRGGNGNTVNQTSSGFNQTSGASFRIIADLSDWDKSQGTNSPGQSGDPRSHHYRDLFDLWSQDKYFPIFFTRVKIESVTETITHLNPVK